MPDVDRAAHWDEAYRGRRFDSVSWYQAEPSTSMELIRSLDVERSVPVVDIGGGTSSLVDHFVAAGFDDLSVLDVSEIALAETRRRLGARTPVSLLHEDVLVWRPTRLYGLWHDRAVFHFLTEPSDREHYLVTLAAALEPGGAAVLATFAEDGPEFCSGLPVARYSADSLGEVLGARFVPLETRRELHRTPAGATQPFTWVAGRLAG